MTMAGADRENHRMQMQRFEFLLIEIMRLLELLIELKERK